MRFLDTSVIFPAFDRRERHHAAAVALLAGADADRPAVSVAILGELYVAFTKGKGRPGDVPLFDHREALHEITLLEPLVDVYDVTAEDWDRLRSAKRRKFSQAGVWDTLHWATAKGIGCDELLTLDPPGGTKALDGVRFVNPFA